VYVVVVSAWVLDLLLLLCLTLLAVLFGNTGSPIRNADGEVRFPAVDHVGLPGPPIVVAAMLSVALLVMAVRARSRAMAWFFGICTVVVPAVAFTI
jgi:hypothetical protein